MKPFASFRSLLAGLLTIAVLLPLATHSETTNPKDPKARQEKAFALYKQHCATAGEKIYKTVDNVEGLFLMKVRPKEIKEFDQFALYDPYGDEAGGDGYIINFLRGRNEKGSLIDKVGGFRYVDAVDPNDGQRYRYTGDYREVTVRNNGLMGGVPGSTFKTHKFVLDRLLAKPPFPRYGVTYDDISTHEDREYWIAGSSLRVIDLQTNEVIAERIGYMIDRGQGSRAGFRAPWLLAARDACPAFPQTGGHPIQLQQTRRFVEQVLHPIQ